jgi:hypothetical protein
VAPTGSSVRLLIGGGWVGFLEPNSLLDPVAAETAVACTRFDLSAAEQKRFELPAAGCIHSEVRAVGNSNSE